MKKQEKDKKILWKLFCSTFTLSAFTFGGGYVIVSMMKKKFVDQYHWISEQEMLDITAIAQSTPGAMAVSSSAAVGYKMAGYPGIAVAVFATVLPCLIILSLVSLFYDAFRSNQIIGWMLDGMQAAVAALIAQVTVSMALNLRKEKNPALSYCVMAAAFLCVSLLDINVIYIILSCIVLGLALSFFGRKEKAA